MLKDYRALLAGMLASAIVETAITYRLTRFRPQLTLVKTRELLGFSVWWVAGQAMNMLGRRGQDLLVGQRLGADSLGQYVVALDIATMSTAELAGPVMRAVYPGYVQMKEETGRIYSAFVRVWGLIALLAIPSAVGTASLASLIADVEPAVERLDQPVVGRLTRPRVIEFDATSIRPFIEGLRGELGAVVDGDRPGQSTLRGGLVERLPDASAGQPEVGL